jgi:hypothetical protein
MLNAFEVERRFVLGGSWNQAVIPGNTTSLSRFGPGRRFRDEKMTEHQTLLAQYATNGSEEAFGELVARYVNLVYSTAVRLLDGDTHRAEDVV